MRRTAPSIAAASRGASPASTAPSTSRSPATPRRALDANPSPSAMRPRTAPGEPLSWASGSRGPCPSAARRAVDSLGSSLPGLRLVTGAGSVSRGFRRRAGVLLALSLDWGAWLEL